MTEIASIQEGSVFLAAELPSHPRDIVFTDQQLAGGRIKFSLDRSALLTAELYDDQQTIDKQEIGIADRYRPGFAVLGITWKRAKFTSVTLDGAPIYPEGLVVDLISSEQLAFSEPTNFSVENDYASKKRKQKLDNFVRDKNRIYGGADYAFEALDAEREQLRDLIEKVENGSRAHVLGMMSRIRLCIIGKPLGLLELCAAFIGLPLTVYTVANPRRDRHSLPPGRTFSFSTDLSATPTGVLKNPIDLAAWLKLRSFSLHSKHFSHLDLIREVGNTVASHVDLDIPPTVIALRSGRTKVDFEMDYLTEYSLRLAKVIIVLSERLIRSREDYPKTS